MARIKKLKRKQRPSKGRDRILKESLREFLGTGLLDSRTTPTMSLFFLKDALNSRILNPRA